MILELLTAFFIISGSVFCFIASVGVLRMPDTIIRMHAVTKAGALGSGLVFLALSFCYMETSTTLRAFAAILFLLLTAPVAAHLIGRAAYCTRVRLWEKTWIDELAYTCDWCKIDEQDDINA